jgi:PAS domain-containing protein
LRQITNTVPALIAYIDAEQRFQFYNLAYEECFGLKYGVISVFVHCGACPLASRPARERAICLAEP